MFDYNVQFDYYYLQTISKMVIIQVDKHIYLHFGITLFQTFFSAVLLFLVRVVIFSFLCLDFAVHPNKQKLSLLMIGFIKLCENVLFVFCRNNSGKVCVNFSIIL